MYNVRTTLVFGDDAAVGGERLRLSDHVDGLHAEHVLLAMDKTGHLSVHLVRIAHLRTGMRSEGISVLFRRVPEHEMCRDKFGMLQFC